MYEHADIALSIHSNKLRFPWGVNSKYNGKLHHNLARMCIVAKFPLPDWEKFKFPDPKFLPDCSFSQTEKHAPAWTTQYDYLKSWLTVMCQAVNPQLQLLKEKEKAYRDETDNKVRDVQAVIPDLESAGRFKRFASALPAIAGLVTLVTESISGFLRRKRNRAIANAIRALERRQDITQNSLQRYKNDLLLYGEFSMNSTKELTETMQDLYVKHTFVESMVRNVSHDWPTRYLSNPAGAAMYAVHLGTYLHAITEKYNTLYRELSLDLYILLRCINQLSKGRLPIDLITPNKLSEFTDDVREQLRLTHPDYTLALPRLSDYYDMNLVTFGLDPKSAVVVVFSIFIKPIHNKALDLYEIESTRVPIEDKNEKANSYSKVRPSKPYIVTSDNHHIQLEMQELGMCKSIQHQHFCEELFMVKHSSIHTCESALFYEADDRVIGNQCVFDLKYNITVPPSVPDEGKEIVLANMNKGKTLKCHNQIQNPLPEGSYIKNRQIHLLSLFHRNRKSLHPKRC